MYSYEDGRSPGVPAEGAQKELSGMAMHRSRQGAVADEPGLLTSSQSAQASRLDHLSRPGQE